MLPKRSRYILYSTPSSMLVMVSSMRVSLKISDCFLVSPPTVVTVSSRKETVWILSVRISAFLMVTLLSISVVRTTVPTSTSST